MDFIALKALVKSVSPHLKTITGYAKEKGLSRQGVYKQMKTGSIETVDIDGVTFILVEAKKVK